MKIDRFQEKIWLSSPTMHGEEQSFIKEAFDTNWVAPLGKNVNEFEEEMAVYVGTRYAAALNSGTAALHLAIKLAGVQAGDLVCCSDLTFAATVNPVSYEGGIQIFIDSEKDTWNMDPIALEKALKKYKGKVKAVIVANLYGTPAKLDEIVALCDFYDVILIEDAAESLSATYKDRQTGTFGKYNCISFNGNKIITTSGGGMLLSDDEEAIRKVRFWATQARDSAPWYQHSEAGYNYRMSNIVAGIGRGQLLHLDEHRRRKKEIYWRYKEGLEKVPVQMNPYLEFTKPNFWLSCLLVDKDAMCRQVRGEKDSLYISEHGKSCPTEILEKLSLYNIEARPIWKPMHLQPMYHTNHFVKAEDTDVSADIFERGLCLPSDIKMTEAQQDAVIEIIKSCFE